MNFVKQWQLGVAQERLKKLLNCGGDPNSGSLCTILYL